MTSADIPELDAKGLRGFGLQLGGLIAFFFGLLLPWLWGLGIPWWPWIGGGTLVVWALAAPASLRPVYRFWMRLALLLQRFVSPIVLALIYYAVFLPSGAVLRIFGKDPMARRWDAAAASYRVPSAAAPADHMKRPF